MAGSIRTTVGNEPAPHERYGFMAMAFHWVTVILVAAAYLLGEGGPEWRVFAADRASSLALHETLGLLVFIVVVLRVLWRLFDASPKELAMPGLMRLASKLVQYALYVLLFAVPLSAIVGSWLAGHPLTLVGGGELASPVGQIQATGLSVLSLHSTLGSLIVWIAGLHAGAALFHHFVLRDGVLKSMLPAGRSSQAHGHAAWNSRDACS